MMILTLLGVIVFFVGTGVLFAWLKSTSQQMIANSDVTKAYNYVKQEWMKTPPPESNKREKSAWDLVTKEDVFSVLKILQEDDKKKD